MLKVTGCLNTFFFFVLLIDMPSMKPKFFFLLCAAALVPRKAELQMRVFRRNGLGFNALKLVRVGLTATSLLLIAFDEGTKKCRSLLALFSVQKSFFAL